MNCVSSDNSFKYFAYLITFASSSAASTSSNITKGADLTFKIANSKAIAVNARSPPLSNDNVATFYPVVVPQYQYQLLNNRLQLIAILHRLHQTIV